MLLTGENALTVAWSGHWSFAHRVGKVPQLKTLLERFRQRRQDYCGMVLCLYARSCMDVASTIIQQRLVWKSLRDIHASKTLKLICGITLRRSFTGGRSKLMSADIVVFSHRLPLPPPPLGKNVPKCPTSGFSRENVYGPLEKSRRSRDP